VFIAAWALGAEARAKARAGAVTQIMERRMVFYLDSSGCCDAAAIILHAIWVLSQVFVVNLVS
jgi:hypothetical protein